MLAVALATLAAVSPADGRYADERVALRVRDGVVTKATATVRHMVCTPFGDIGPLHVVVTPGAPVGDDGRVRFTAGPPSERLTVRARFGAHGKARGRLIVRGTIGTGDPCRSPWMRFVVG